MSALLLTAAQASSVGQEKARRLQRRHVGGRRPGRGRPGRVGGDEEVGRIAGDAELGRGAGDAVQDPEAAERGRRDPGRRAAGRIGGADDRAVAADRDAERFGRAGDAGQFERQPEFGDVPDGRPGRVGRGDDLAARGDADAERDRGAGDAIDVDPRFLSRPGGRSPTRPALRRPGWSRRRCSPGGSSRRRIRSSGRRRRGPGRRRSTRSGCSGALLRPVEVGDDSRPRCRRSGCSSWRGPRCCRRRRRGWARGRRRRRGPSILPAAGSGSTAGPRPVGEERQGEGREHGDERAACRAGHGSHGDRPSFDRRQQSPRSRKTQPCGRVALRIRRARTRRRPRRSGGCACGRSPPR